MSVLYCQSPALFWCALALIVCFFVRRGAHRVRAVLDLVLGLLCIVGQDIGRLVKRKIESIPLGIIENPKQGEKSFASDQ